MPLRYPSSGGAMSLLWLLACGSPTASDSTTTPTPTEEPPLCTPVAAVFFDIGDTLAAAGDDGKYVAFPEALALLDSLEAKALPLGIITNVPETWEMSDLEDLLADPSLLDRFD